MLGSGTIHSQASMFVKIMFFFLHYLLQSAWSAASLKKNRKRDNFSDYLSFWLSKSVIDKCLPVCPHYDRVFEHLI